MNDILNYMPYLKDKELDYIQSIQHRYNNYMQYCELPLKYFNLANITIIHPTLNRFCNNILDAVSGRCNYGFIVKEFDDNTGYLASLIIHKYFISCIEKDHILDNFLYVDTNLLLEDYKRLMNYNEDNTSPMPVHSLQTLYRSIEEAPIVIWNRFNKFKSEYDKNKLSEILLIRQRRNLGNFFIISGAAALAEISSTSPDLMDLMDIGIYFKLYDRQYLSIQNKEVKMI